MVDIKKALARCARRVDRQMERLLAKGTVPPASLHRAMRYSVFAGGKRLRPLLCLAAAELVGGKKAARRALPAAAALEMVHTYSLVHDDLPAMDDDDFRRGRLTCHRKYGEAQAILAGDALLTGAFEVLASAAGTVPPHRLLSAIGTVARGAGSRGMVGGQAVDLQAEKPPRSLSRRRALLAFIHERKTGALIRASLACGAHLAGATPRQLKALDRYGRAIGLAFQIADDILDITGDKKKLGKHGSDRDNHKLTFPAVYGLGTSRLLARREVRAAQRALAPFGRRAAVLSALADFIVERDH